MKAKMTKKEVVNNFNNIINMPIGRLGILLMQYDDNYCKCNKNGVYKIDSSTCIVTGANPFGNFNPSIKIIEKYEKKVNNMLFKYFFNDKQDKFYRIMKSFIKEVTKSE